MFTTAKGAGDDGVHEFRNGVAVSSGGEGGGGSVGGGKGKGGGR